MYMEKMKMNKYLLQRILLPNTTDRNYRDLFFRVGQVECSAFNQKLAISTELYFNTWMNLFAGRKWFHFCELDDLYLGVNIKGKFSIEIIGSIKNTAYYRIDERLFFHEYDLNQEDFIYIKVEEAKKYDSIYFVLRYLKNEPCIINNMGWYTNTRPKRHNRLAIITCTYKRENYIRKTIQLFEDYLNENVELRDRMHLFISDNGQTLDAGYKSDFVSIYPNINAGGAGGFGRGLIEVCKSSVEYTRCIFMDDDVEILPESFYRTLILSDYLKEEYSDAMINGAMLDLYNKVLFVENLAVQDGLWCHPYHNITDLLNYDEILKVNYIPEDVFYKEYPKTNGAWFYCSFAIDPKRSIDDLPLPIFIRGDDVEYGYRNSGKVIIQLNGICIWHAPFYFRVNKVTDSYYLSRNMFIINSLYTNGFKESFRKLYSEKFNYAIATYDYVSAKLIINALHDVLKGKSLFKEDPLEIMNKITLLSKENYEAVSDPYELINIRNKQIDYPRYRRIINKCIKGLYKFFPKTKCIFKRNGINSISEWYPSVDVFLMKKQVRVYNLLKEESIVRRFDFKTEQNLKNDFKTVLDKLYNNYDKISTEFSDCYKEITSYDYWKKYLKIEGE